jgi:S1-C subfamily serine protease
MRHALAVSILLLFAGALLAGEPPRPGWLGMGINYHPPVVNASGSTGWIFVQQLAPDGPASASGVRSQDVIAKIDGKPLRFADAAGLMEWLAAIKPGQRLTLDIRRGAETVRLRVMAISMPDAMYQLWKQSMAVAARQPPHH